MSARSGDLQRALDIFLSHDVGKVGAGLARLLRLPLRLGRELLFTLQMLHERHDVRHAVNGHAVGKRRLRCVRRGDIERPDPRTRRGHRHRQNAVHRAKRAGQRQLADKGRVLGGGLDLLCTGKDAEQDGQVIERALLFPTRGGEVHRDARDRELHTAVFHCRAHALARFLDGRVAKADDVKRRQAPG